MEIRLYKYFFRRFIIKKLIFCCILLIFLSFILTCGDFKSVEITEEKIIYTNVEYYENGITIYLNGPVPVPASRALSKSLAIIGHDFFEVTFLYRSTATEYIVARGTWELGEDAGIDGIYRINPVNYGLPINVASLPTDGTGGTAILFAGKKTDKTLLAVGALSDARDSNGDSGKYGGGIWLSSNTISVSFELNALRAGAPTFTANGAAASGDILVGNRKYPVFAVPDNNGSIPASYTIQTHSATNNFAYYQNGIILAPDPVPSPLPPADLPHYPFNNYPFYRVANIKPHYTYPDEDPANTTYWRLATYDWSENTIVTLANNTAASGVFQNPVNFTLNTTNASVVEKQILSITFQIPVFALRGVNAQEPSPVMWFIRPGYDYYRMELDNGQFGNGGALLISIGVIADNPLYAFRMLVPPNILFYNTGNYVLDLTGSKFQFAMTGGVNLATFDDGSTTVTTGDNGGSLRYIIDWDNNFEETGQVGPYITTPPYNNNGDEVLPVSGSPPKPVKTFPNTMNRYLTIIVEYTDPNYNSHNPLVNVYYAYFKVFVSTLSVAGVIPPQNRFVIGNTNDANISIQASLDNSAGGLYLFVFTQSFDLDPTTFNILGNVTAIFTTVFPNLTIGRSGANPISFNGVGRSATFFFGKWPMNDPIIVAGLILDDQPFRINTRGSWRDYNQPGANYTTPMFTQGNLASFTLIKSEEIEQWGNYLGN
jgi:hypothetical protein